MSSEATVVTWNLGLASNRTSGLHERGLRYLIDELRPDLALLQECSIPDWVRETYDVESGDHYPTVPGWGSAILARKGLGLHRADITGNQWLSRYDGAVVCANLNLHGPIFVASIHAKAKVTPVAELMGITEEERLRCTVPPFTDIWPLYQIFVGLDDYISLGHGRPDRKRFIVGGDLNAARLFDEVYGPSGNSAFFDKADAYGFKAWVSRFHTVEQQTWFRAGDRAYQLDHLFSDVATLDVLTAIRVDVLAVDERLSDHAPLIASLSI